MGHEIDAYQGYSANGTKLKSINTSYTYAADYYYQDLPQSLNGGQPNQPNSRQVNYQYPASVVTTTTLPEVGLTTKTESDLIALGAIPSAVKEWDFYSGTAPANPTQETDYTYCNGIPAQTTKDGAGNLIAQTINSFDQTSLAATSGLSHHNSVSGTRCNLTTTSQWINSSGATLTTTATYDDAGTLLTQTDPNGTTTYGHDSTDTFVTSTTPPTPSSGVSLATSASYDFSTGLLNSTTDPNGTQASYKNYDAFGRVGEIDNLDSSGNMVGKSTNFYYSSQDVGISNYQNAGTAANVRTLVDGYGRPSRTATYNGNAWYQQDTCYDANGNANFQSYKYQGAGWNTAKSCSGSGDTYSYDALGRVKSITHSDGTNIQYNYVGNATQITDENGVSRITQVDGLGRITSVCEVTPYALIGSGSPTSCGTAIAGTGYVTSYAYDLANHKTTVTQGPQQRIFQTDWLGRTILTQEPERGQTTYYYGYNSTGLVVTRQRAHANQGNSNTLTSTTTQYDSLGRKLYVTYSDGTPRKDFYFDQTGLFGGTYSTGASKGRLTEHGVSVDGNSAATAYQYDAMGRVTLAVECLPSGCGNGAKDKHSSYTYDWLGNIITATDGAGVTITYGYNQANQITSISSSLNGPTYPSSLVSNVQNGPNGPVSYQLGNSLKASLSYDSLGRPSGGSVACGSTTSNNCAAGTQLYAYLNSWSGTRSTSECDDALGKCMIFGYDYLNHLNNVHTTQGTAQDFSYGTDRYGNRWQQNVTAGSGPSPQFTYSSNDNLIIGDGYDVVGNLNSDGLHTYTYDAEGNLTQVDGGATAKYTYNAMNQRVRIDQGSTAREFVFNLNGQRTSIWDANTGNQIQGQVYWGGLPVEFYANGAAHFQHQDWQGTERMRTSYNGAVEATYKSLPYGDAFAAYGQDSDPYHFGMLDHDGETDTDHAQFRQYSPTQGRWMSPDPYDGSYDFSNPQSFNRYSYVMNNPLSAIDPSGLDGNPIPGGGAIGGCVGAAIDGGANPFADIGCALSIFGLFGGGPSFHGSLKPRPNAQPWDEYNIHYGPNIAGALGLPDAGCEFGACGAGPSSLTPGQRVALGGPIILTPPQWLVSFVAQFTTATGNALHAPPLKVNSGVCSIYGNQRYLRAGLQCVCQSAGDSPWSQDTRGALAADQLNGIPEFIGHATSYTGSTLRTGLPPVAVPKAYGSCFSW